MYQRTNVGINVGTNVGINVGTNVGDVHGREYAGIPSQRRRHDMDHGANMGKSTWVNQKMYQRW